VDHPVPDERAIRVFVSSTFRDMQAERDELVKRIFPQVRALCEARGVAWSEVDLRWGVTDEQKAEGAVLPICLAEIERTRPYFIGLLGQRYGWVPDEIPAALADQLGWLGDDAGRSVTELEILHGVLNDPAAAGHAFFYLRDPAWLDRVDPAELSTFVEESDIGRQRLADLRDRIRSSGHPTAEYADPVDLGRKVLADLTALVEQRYPDVTPPDPETRARIAHAAYVDVRYGDHVRRPAVDDALATLLASPGLPILVTGAPGAGASSSVADWVRRHRATGDVFVHVVDAEQEAADHRNVAARLIAALAAGELADQLGGPGDDAAAVRSSLRRAFRAFAASGRTVIAVIDGVDRLDDVEGALDLRWLPDEVPTNLRIVVTASGDRTRAIWDHRGWQMLEVPPLDDAERRDLTTTFLARSAKALDPHHLDALVGAPAAGNAGYLRIVLDELRQHGDHFTIGEVIATLTSAATTDDLLELVLQRWETDFERDHPGLVRRVVTALWAARRGLTEHELLQIAGTDGDIVQATWAPLHLAAEHHLVSRNGLLAIGGHDLRQAVEDRYLADPAARVEAHRTLATYFSSIPLSDRVADELPWQQAAALDMDGLAATLADLELVERAYTRSPAGVRRLWALLEPPGSGGTRMRDAFAPVVADPAAFDAERDDRPSPRQLVWGAARLLADAGHTSDALVLLRASLGAARLRPAGRREGPGGDERLRAALVNLGAAEWSSGRLDDALAHLGEAVDRCRRAGDEVMLASALGNLGLVERELRHDVAAGAIFAEEQALWRDLDDAGGLQSSLGNHAQLLRTAGRYDEALAMLREQEELCRGLGDEAGVTRARAGQATVLADRGDATEAIALQGDQVERTRTEGDVRGLAEALLNRSVSAMQVGDLDAARQDLDEATGHARALEQPELLGRVLAASANVAAMSGDWPSAERLAREAELTARHASADAPLALALGILGTARREQGDLAAARTAHDEELAVARRADDPAATAKALTNLGNVAIAAQRYDEMFAHYGEAEPILVELDLPSLLLPLVANRGQVHHALGNAPQALADLTAAALLAERLENPAGAKQWAEIAIPLAAQTGDVLRLDQLWQVMGGAARVAGDARALQLALGERALALIGRSQSLDVGDPAGQVLLADAAILLDEQYQLCTMLGDDVGLAAAVGNRAIVLRYEGDLAGSLACLDEQLAVATRSGNGQAALFATANRGEVLGLLGRTDEAIAALSSARATAAQHGIGPMVQQLDAMIAALRHPGPT
jgi:tetratricopeptide (TPR) repeat protein